MSSIFPESIQIINDPTASTFSLYHPVLIAQPPQPLQQILPEMIQSKSGEPDPNLPFITVSPPGGEELKLDHSVIQDEQRRLKNYHARRVRYVRKWVDASIQERMRSLEKQNEQLRQALCYLHAELRRVQQQAAHRNDAEQTTMVGTEMPIQ
ncbi:hypothetical protein PRIPAC_80817 [Pristionchus pacificus]|uniref:Uncharacterized protein n=1 Tax=Pristionchus pacificus TaxID=54126 RepID=A0A2A6CNR6_PRIPA|nr:hypothetical protein PRIPAC_80817 [Pristionchus pacificus]|eukprot:PDM79738.1 hypothetical protein PRIPAC_32317 [Pristionchus pacificus]